MKHKHNYRSLLMGLMAALFMSAVFLSCKDDDPSLAELRDDKISYLEDSLHVSDSLRRLNQAGVVNYSITVVSGSTSTLFKSENNVLDDVDRTQQTADLVEGALVTISQFGKVVTDTTDATGMVVFNGFFRGAVNVVVRKDNFTTAAFVTAVKMDDHTENGTISFVGNLIPIFELTGANTATVSGIAKIQSDLTNTTRENVPDGTTLVANIDATNPDFAERFLTPTEAAVGLSIGGVSSDEATDVDIVILDGIILEAAYSTNIVGTVSGGVYTITVPSAIDGLPIKVKYSDVALDRKRFDISDDPNSSNRTITERTLYGFDMGATIVPLGGGVDIDFITGEGAEAISRISLAGTLEAIDIIDGGDSYSGVPTVKITNGGGTGATATAVVVNGKVSAVTVTNKGTGYTSAPDIELVTGFGATAGSTLANDGKVMSVNILNGGVAYTSAPTVAFVGGGAPTTVATGTATISGGRVTGITITNAGAGYTSAPAITFTGGGATTDAVATANFSGRSVQNVFMTFEGQDYTYAPTVRFSDPDVANGVRATGVVSFDANSRTINNITLTNPGSGYTGTPTVTIDGGSGAFAQGRLTGGPLAGIDVVAAGDNYTAAPTVMITGGGGSGATATAAINAGHVTAITLTNGGTGYTSEPEITLLSGEGAQGVATVGANGAITGVRITTNGSGYTGAPSVMFTAADGRGSGATGTATIASGQVSAVTVTAGGSGYVQGNTPGDSADYFAATLGCFFKARTGLKYINDIYYGSGSATPN